MYTRRRLGGFWSTIFHGSEAAGHVAVHATEGFVTGGPSGAIKGGAESAVAQIEGAVKGSSKSGTTAAAPNWFDTLNNEQLAVFATGGAAIVLLLMSRRR